MVRNPTDDDPDVVMQRAKAIRSIRAELSRQQKRLEHWSAKYDTVKDVRGKALERGQYRRSLAWAKAKIEELEMRKSALEDHPVAAQSTLPWVANVQLNFGGVVYHRGQVIPTDLLEASANYDRLVHGGYVRQVPLRSAARWPKPSPVPTKPVERAVAPPTAMQIARQELRAVAKRRGVDLRSAVDLVDSKVLLLAQQELAASRRMVRRGAWGSGGGSMQLVGEGVAGVSSRPTDDFMDALIAPECGKETAA
jgi:hypothetical protein